MSNRQTDGNWSRNDQVLNNEQVVYDPEYMQMLVSAIASARNTPNTHPSVGTPPVVGGGGLVHSAGWAGRNPALEGAPMTGSIGSSVTAGTTGATQVASSSSAIPGTSSWRVAEDLTKAEKPWEKYCKCGKYFAKPKRHWDKACLYNPNRDGREACPECGQEITNRLDNLERHMKDMHGMDFDQI